MEEENGGKIAECGESSITPPVNNSEGKRLLLKNILVPTKMELFLISFCCVLPHSLDEHSLFHEQAPLIFSLDYLQS